jgi:hypothetical protein
VAARSLSGDSDMRSCQVGPRVGAIGAALLWCALGVASPLAAQTAPASALKAALLLNFVKFSEWPADALTAGGPIVFCVIGDDAIEQSLKEIIKGQTIDGHSLVVRHQGIDISMRSCHLLYAANFDAKRSTQLIEMVKAAAVLTVGDADHFTRLGGVARLFTVHGKMRFAVNLESVQRSGLRLSSRLLGLATITNDASSVQH